jgi:outer membrane lipoprotein-sorting protein
MRAVMRLLAVLSFAFAFCPYRAYAQNLSPADILKKVAENYGRVSSFSVVAERKVERDTDTSGEKYRPGNLDSPTTVVVGSHESDHIQITLMASGSSKERLLLRHDNEEVLGGDKKEILVVANGKVVWTLIPAQHAYSKVTASSAGIQRPSYIEIGSKDISGVDLLWEYETVMFDRFRSISDHGSSAKLEHSEALKVSNDKKECYVLTIRGPRDTQKQKLWIDKKEFIVWKTVDTTLEPQDYRGDSLQTTVTVTTKQMNLNASLEESNFDFTPPNQAKRVDSLKLSGTNPF